MNWKIEEAQQKFSEVIDATVAEPQLIYNQDKLVAAVVEIEIFQEFLAWQQQQRQTVGRGAQTRSGETVAFARTGRASTSRGAADLPFLADAFAQLRQLCALENYIIEIGDSLGDSFASREDRFNSFLDNLP